jgi:hypothetical protein
MIVAHRSLAGLALAGSIPIATVTARKASFVYRLGNDTLAVEQYTRTATKLTCEAVSRNGVAVVRTQYNATLGKDGKVTPTTYKIPGADGTPIKGTACRSAVDRLMSSRRVDGADPSTRFARSG